MIDSTTGASVRIPLTVVGGFLGSGKTTLLNYILRNAGGRRFAVIVNDFGAINIDAKLVVSVEGETIALTNGCICCVIRDDLVAAVLKLCAGPDRPDHIIIESSGVSKPVAIVESFFRAEVRQHVDVQSIVTLLDADQVVDPEATYADVAYAQIAVADLVVINKMDLVAPESLAEIRKKVEQIVPRARILETRFGILPMELLFEQDLSVAAARLKAPPAHDHTHEDTVDHDHLHAFTSLHYRDDSLDFTLGALQQMVERLPQGIFRAKGIVRLSLPSNDYGVLQVTGRRGWLKLVPTPQDKEVTTELVFIGRPGTIDETGLRRYIQSCWEAANIPDRRPQIVSDLRAFQVEFV